MTQKKNPKGHSKKGQPVFFFPLGIAVPFVFYRSAWNILQVLVFLHVNKEESVVKQKDRLIWMQKAPSSDVNQRG